MGMGMGMGMVGLLPDHSVIPLLTVPDDHHAAAGGGGGHGGHRGLPSTAAGPIHFWQPHDSAATHQQQQHHLQASYLKKPAPIDPSLDRIFTHPSTAAVGVGASSGTATCQDCGNQAKKDCSHRRCRTCCKSRGFDCTTHVKSTWVPAARRRERHVSTAGAGAGSSTSASTTKKPRLVSSNTTTSHTSTSNTTPPRSFDSGSSHQDASFKESLPGQVKAPALFKCVRVTAIDDGEDEYAYQAMVKIGGHVFKGFLYDQGVEGTSRGEAMPSLSDLHLGGAARATRAAAGGSSSSPVIDPSDVYAVSAPPGLLGGGSSFGNPLN